METIQKFILELNSRGSAVHCNRCRGQSFKLKLKFCSTMRFSSGVNFKHAFTKKTKTIFISIAVNQAKHNFHSSIIYQYKCKYTNYILLISFSLSTYMNIFTYIYILADFDKAFVSIDPPDDNEYPYALNANEGIDRLFDFSSDAYGP